MATTRTGRAGRKASKGKGGSQKDDGLSVEECKKETRAGKRGSMEVASSSHGHKRTKISAAWSDAKSRADTWKLKLQERMRRKREEEEARKREHAKERQVEEAKPSVARAAGMSQDIGRGAEEVDMSHAKESREQELLRARRKQGPGKIAFGASSPPPIVPKQRGRTKAGVKEARAREIARSKRFHEERGLTVSHMSTRVRDPVTRGNVNQSGGQEKFHRSDPSTDGQEDMNAGSTSPNSEDSSVVLKMPAVDSDLSNDDSGTEGKGFSAGAKSAFADESQALSQRDVVQHAAGRQHVQVQGHSVANGEEGTQSSDGQAPVMGDDAAGHSAVDDGVSSLVGENESDEADEELDDNVAEPEPFAGADREVALQIQAEIAEQLALIPVARRHEKAEEWLLRHHVEKCLAWAGKNEAEREAILVDGLSFDNRVAHLNRCHMRRLIETEALFIKHLSASQLENHLRFHPITDESVAAVERACGETQNPVLQLLAPSGIGQPVVGTVAGVTREDFPGFRHLVHHEFVETKLRSLHFGDPLSGDDGEDNRERAGFLDEFHRLMESHRVSAELHALPESERLSQAQAHARDTQEAQDMVEFSSLDEAKREVRTIHLCDNRLLVKWLLDVRRFELVTREAKSLDSLDRDNFVDHFGVIELRSNAEKEADLIHSKTHTELVQHLRNDFGLMSRLGCDDIPQHNEVLFTQQLRTMATQLLQLSSADLAKVLAI